MSLFSMILSSVLCHCWLGSIRNGILICKTAPNIPRVFSSKFLWDPAEPGVNTKCCKVIWLNKNVCPVYRKSIQTMKFAATILKVHFVAGFRKTWVLKKAQPGGFWGFVGFWALLGFLDFLFEWTVGKLVGWFSSSAKLLFRFASTSDYLKICKFNTYWSLESLNIKKSLIITGMTNWNWVKFGAGFLLVFHRILPGCLNPAFWDST